jgi:hypothetical protein
LDRALEIDAENVLEVDVGYQFFEVRRPFGLDAADAAGEGVEFSRNDVTIHGAGR